MLSSWSYLVGLSCFYWGDRLVFKSTSSAVFKYSSISEMIPSPLILGVPGYFLGIISPIFFQLCG